VGDGQGWRLICAAGGPPRAREERGAMTPYDGHTSL
jgi:hypothetical protein